MMLSALFPKGNGMSHDAQSAPDIVFLRNIGIALMALTIATGAICVVGSLQYNEPLVLAQSVDGNAATTDLMLIKPRLIGWAGALSNIWFCTVEVFNCA
jgi:hypothetical protein